MLRVGVARAQLSGRPRVASCAPPPTPSFNVGQATSATVATCKIVSIRPGGSLVCGRAGNIKSEGGGEGHDTLWMEGCNEMHARFSPSTVALHSSPFLSKPTC